MHRHPLAGGAQRQGEIGFRHRRGKVGAQFGGALTTLDGGDVEPLVGGDQVDVASATRRLHQAHVAEDFSAVLAARHGGRFGVLKVKACHFR